MAGEPTRSCGAGGFLLPARCGTKCPTDGRWTGILFPNLKLDWRGCSYESLQRLENETNERNTEKSFATDGTCPCSGRNSRSYNWRGDERMAGRLQSSAPRLGPPAGDDRGRVVGGAATRTRGLADTADIRGGDDCRRNCRRHG